MRAQSGHGLKRHGDAQQPQHEESSPAIHAAQSSIAEVTLANERRRSIGKPRGVGIVAIGSMLEKMKRLEVRSTSGEDNEIDDAHDRDQRE
ncbi:hypothetical protein PMO31116_01244 [Pandoraea morbifera]|uniref:Uncharacterized protein n=1 Tax=Pandoraea morbifera TaxID=2508300 RepID=A0A5E4TCG1_9BURK|nr:hypothetical protein PMO31116_01244 [Pandoraea morbifera]